MVAQPQKPRYLPRREQTIARDPTPDRRQQLYHDFTLPTSRHATLCAILSKATDTQSHCRNVLGRFEIHSPSFDLPPLTSLGFKKNVNRATTQVMMKTGHVERTNDRDYEVEERRYRTMESASMRLQKEAKGYLDSLRGRAG